MSKLFPVVDGDEGGVAVFGYAATAKGAMRVARRAWTADPISHVEFYGPIHMPDGAVLPLAWVFITGPHDV